MLLHAIATASAEVAGLPGRLDKVERLAAVIGRLEPAEAAIGVAWLAGDLPQGRIGVGWSTLRDLASVEPAAEPTLGLVEVDDVFGRVASATGAGSRAVRTGLLRELYRRATALEQDFLTRLVLGELRQGAQEGVVLEAVARAAGVEAADVRRGVMLGGEAAATAARVLRDGAEALAGLAIEPFRPIKPMLATTAEGVEDALVRLGPAGGGRVLFEHKYDGARLQVHRNGDEVRVYTRRLNDETPGLPEIVDAVRALPATSLVLDAEALSLGTDGRPRPFQQTMRRFGRTSRVDDVREQVPLTPFFFDLLHLDGESWLDRPTAERVEALGRLVPDELRVPRLVTADAGEARAFLLDARARGHEGLMAKALDASYSAGRRGSAWLKIKPTFTADLVVLAVEWGSGRRRGWLSNLHLGARDAEAPPAAENDAPPRGGADPRFIMVGKTFKGMTDDMLRWQTERLLELEVERRGHVVRVRPELVVEVAFDGLQRSPRYAGGVVLRFARVRAYREDKEPGDADTIQHLRDLHRRWGGE